MNASDRRLGWAKNYRNPDVVVYFADSPAVSHGTHWQGGPDFAVEVVSPGENVRAKFPFYAAVSTRELLVVLRDPWALELWRPVAGVMTLACRTEPGQAACDSAVMPLWFALLPGVARPTLAMTGAPTGRVWTA